MIHAQAGGKIKNINVHVAAGGQINNNFNQVTLDPQPTKVWFQVPVGIKSFCGREEFLSDLHNILLQNKSANYVTILSQLKVVSGLGGIGKTQTALKYIQQFGKFYENVIWIPAETKTTIKSSFFQLADKLKISTKDSEGKEKNLEIIVELIFKRLCAREKPTLFVFDNADDFESGIEQFLPLTVDPDLNKLVILVTLRNQEWELRHEKFQVVRLEIFSYEESLKLVLTQLGIPDSPEIREETREFIELMGGLPLALQQSVAYIKEKRSQTRQSYKFSDYIDEFRSAMEKVLDYDKIPGSPSTIFVTWNVTFEKLKTLENGQSSIEILENLSFLYADKIPATLIQSLFPKLDKTEIRSCLTLLEKYSLIKCESAGNEDGHVSIHRQVQFVIMKNLKDLPSQQTAVKILKRFWSVFKTVNLDKSIESVFDNIVDKCLDILKTINLATSADLFTNINQIIKNPFNFIPITERFLNFMIEFSVVLRDAGRYSESFNLLENIYNSRRELLGENHQKTLETQRILVECLTHLGKYDKALNLCENVLKRMKTHLSPNHPSTLALKHVMGSVLFYQENYPESLNLLTEVLEQRKKVHGENHRQTLFTQELLALVYLRQGESTTALKLFEDVERKQIEIHEADHPGTLTTMHNRATTLLKLERVKEASDLLRHVYEKEKSILGENHPNTIATLGWIAEVVEKEGKLEEALELKRQVLEARKSVLGDDHPDTKRVERKIKDLIQKMRTDSTAETSPDCRK